MEVMLDLETLAVSPRANIATIGAIKWKRGEATGQLKDMDTFYRRIDLNKGAAKELDVSQETLFWWRGQGESARKEIFERKNRVDLTDALNDFTKWYGDAKHVWANGDDFDCVILTEAYRACDLVPPWKYWETRDVRTLLDLGNTRLERVANGHHALIDCYNQIKSCQVALKELGY